MNIMNGSLSLKRLIGIAAVSVALVAGATYAYSDEAEAPAICRYGEFSKLAPDLIEKGAKVAPLPADLVKVLVDQKGPPPGAEGHEFTVARIDMNDFSALVVLVGDCIQDKVGPIPTPMLDHFLGLSNG